MINHLREINVFLLIVVLIVGLYRLQNIKHQYYYYIASIFFAVVIQILLYVVVDRFFYNALLLVNDLKHNVFLYLFFTVTYLRKQNKNIFFIIFFTIIVLSIPIIFIDLYHTPGYLNNYLQFFVHSILVIVLLHRLNSGFNNKIIIYNINKSELLILIPKIIYLLYNILLTILMGFLFNNHTKQLFINLYYVMMYISICSSILAIIALLIAPKREKYA
jgi:hypothetical protein